MDYSVNLDLLKDARGVDEKTEERILAKPCGEPLSTCPDGLYIPSEVLRVFLSSFEGPLDHLEDAVVVKDA